MRKFSLFLVLISLLSCTKSVEFNKLAIDVSLDVEQQKNAGNPHFYLEYFVIKNPPGNYDKLRSLIDSFNTSRSFLPDTLQRYDYMRFFYKETKFTPRTFKEYEKKRSGYFSVTDDIGNHQKDKLLQQTWSKSECWMYIAYTFYKNEDILHNKDFYTTKKITCDSNITAPVNFEK